MRAKKGFEGLPWWLVSLIIGVLGLLVILLIVGVFGGKFDSFLLWLGLL